MSGCVNATLHVMLVVQSTFTLGHGSVSSEYISGSGHLSSPPHLFFYPFYQLNSLPTSHWSLSMCVFFFIYLSVLTSVVKKCDLSKLAWQDSLTLLCHCSLFLPFKSFLSSSRHVPILTLRSYMSNILQYLIFFYFFSKLCLVLFPLSSFSFISFTHLHLVYFFYT